MASDHLFDRRFLLRAAFGGPAAVSLAAGMLGADAAAAAQGAPRPPPEPCGGWSPHDAQGRSFIAVDDTVPIADVWRTQPDKPIGTVPANEQLLVTRATGETRFFAAAIPLSSDPKPNLQNRLGFHRTGGIACCCILDGELAFLVDTQEVRVRAGDLVVERNTMHSWRNEGSEPVSMAITVVTAVA